MEREQKKLIIKYLYFVCIGIIIGYIIGHCGNRIDIIDDKQDNITDVNPNDTIYSVNMWYGDYDVPDTIANETFIP